MTNSTLSTGYSQLPLGFPSWAMTESNRVLLQPQALVDDRWFEDVDYFHVGSDDIADGCDDDEFTNAFCLLCEWITTDRAQSCCALRLCTSLLCC